MARRDQLMQRGLDNDLTTEEAAALRQHLQDDADAAQVYNRLHQVDSMLREAPQARAPQGMAAKILANLGDLAEMVDLRRLSRVSGLALAVGLALVAGVMIPILVVTIWLVIAALTSGLGLAGVVQQIAALLEVIVNLGQGMLLRLQLLLSAHPIVSLLLVALIFLKTFQCHSFGTWQSGQVARTPLRFE